MTAYIKLDSPYFVLNAYHEFFGHGLFCEYSLIGRRLRSLHGKHAQEYLYSLVSPEEQFFGITNYNIHNYEGFAMWLEELLSKETGYADLFQKKMDELTIDDKILLNYFKESEQRLTRFGFLAQLGFPKHYTPKTLDDFLKEKYKYYNDAEIILLYGSKKPYSDIDLFIVTRAKTTNYFNGWLDIYQVNKEEFITLLELLDISITDPLLTGVLVKGDETLLKEYKEKIAHQEITRNAILHNQLMSENQLLLSQDKELSLREREVAKNYALTYMLNAQCLQKGIKLLTKQELTKKSVKVGIGSINQTRLKLRS